LGIGPNHFVQIANMDGYYQNAGVLSSRGSNVHNVYWLVASETGWLGLITFTVLLVRPLSVTFFCGLRHRGDRRGDLLLGLGVALLVVYIHSFFEWIFLLPDTQYIFAVTVGLVAGLAQQLGYWRHSQRKLSASRHHLHTLAVKSHLC